MKSVKSWFEEYGESHQNKVNIIIHKFCVPLITWSLLGILWTLPVPTSFLSYGLNWGHFFILICLIFYISLRSLRLLAAVLTLIIPAIFGLHILWPILGHRLLYLSLFVFVIAWIGQFIGHKIEGKKPSFFKDIQFLLIGPAWVMKDLFKIVKK